MSKDVNPYQSPIENAYQRPIQGRRGRSTQFRPGHTRAIVAILLLTLSIVASLLQAGSTFLQIRLLDLATQGAPISSEAAIENDLRQTVAQLLVLAALVVSGIAFIVWFYRAGANLRSLGIERPSYSPGWTIGAWFIPIGNLVMPYFVMAEVWNGSAPKNAASRYATRAPGLTLVRWWWASYLVMSLVPAIGIIFVAGKNLDSLILVSWLVIVKDLLALVAGVLAIQVVRRVDANQTERYRAVEELIARKPKTTFDFLGMEGDGSESRPAQAAADEFLMPWREKSE